jgi:hypothetical protein
MQTDRRSVRGCLGDPTAPVMPWWARKVARMSLEGLRGKPRGRKAPSSQLKRRHLGGNVCNNFRKTGACNA